MKVFISWSGVKSKAVAEVLREWIPNVIRCVDPFISSEDIDAGTAWFSKIKQELDHCSFGVICLTKSNKDAPWLLYEAGALAHKVDRSNVVPLMIDLSPSDFGTPLSLFQACSRDKDSFFRVVKSINDRAGERGLDQQRLVRVYETWWPSLERKFTELVDFDEGEAEFDGQSKEDHLPREKLDQSIDEILTRLRTISVRMDELRSESNWRAKNASLANYLLGKNSAQDSIISSLGSSLSGSLGINAENDDVLKWYSKDLSDLLKKNTKEENDESRKKGGRKVDTDDQSEDSE